MNKKQYAHEIQDIKIAADVVTFAYLEDELYVLLIQREYPPFAGQWAIPGGFVRIDEDVEAAAVRIVRDETGVQTVEYIEELGVFGKINRDPRRRVISAAYIVLMNETAPVQGQITDYMATSDARWWKYAEIPDQLAFDHEEIITKAKKKLSTQILTTNVGRWLLPRQFKASELHTLYTKITGKESNEAILLQALEAQGLIIEATRKPGHWEYTF